MERSIVRGCNYKFACPILSCGIRPYRGGIVHLPMQLDIVPSWVKDGRSFQTRSIFSNMPPYRAMQLLTLLMIAILDIMLQKVLPKMMVIFEIR